MAYLSRKELESLYFKKLGRNVLISDKCSIYGASNIVIGNNVRIDDYCILSCGEKGILIGNNIHIACYTSIIGKGRVELNDFCNISSKVAIYSSNDDYSGEYMTNPTIPTQFTNVTHGKVIIGKHSIIGCGTVILPNVIIGDNVSIGALSLVKINCDSNKIYAGNPIKFIKSKSKNIYKLEKDFLSFQNKSI